MSLSILVIMLLTIVTYIFTFSSSVSGDSSRLPSPIPLQDSVLGFYAHYLVIKMSFSNVLLYNLT